MQVKHKCCLHEICCVFFKLILMLRSFFLSQVQCSWCHSVFTVAVLSKYVAAEKGWKWAGSSRCCVYWKQSQRKKTHTHVYCSHLCPSPSTVRKPSICGSASLSHLKCEVKLHLSHLSPAPCLSLSTCVALYGTVLRPGLYRIQVLVLSLLRSDHWDEVLWLFWFRSSDHVCVRVWVCVSPQWGWRPWVYGQSVTRPLSPCPHVTWRPHLSHLQKRTHTYTHTSTFSLALSQCNTHPLTSEQLSMSVLDCIRAHYMKLIHWGWRWTQPISWPAHFPPCIFISARTLWLLMIVIVSSWGQETDSQLMQVELKPRNMMTTRWAGRWPQMKLYSWWWVHRLL